jgi:hypothetical protein
MYDQAHGKKQLLLTHPGIQINYHKLPSRSYIPAPNDLLYHRSTIIKKDRDPQYYRLSIFTCASIKFHLISISVVLLTISKTTSSPSLSDKVRLNE